MLNSGQNPEVCDATEDAQGTEAGAIITLFLNLLL